MRFQASFLRVVLIFSVLICFTSCDNNNNTSDGQARTENDFVNNPGQKANPEKDLVVMFLEHLTAPPHDNQTGELGFDVFTFNYKRTLSHTFCWEDENEGAGHFMVMRNDDGGDVLRVEANGGCVTEVIPAGNYVVTLTHDNLTQTIHPIFIEPQQEGELAEASGLFERIGVYMTSLLAKVDLTEISYAQTNNLTTLMNTGICVNCDLEEADLSGQDLNHVILTGADLFEADLSDADLNHAILTNAVLASANMSGADLSNVIMNGADLNKTNLNDTNCDQGIFTGADFDDANANRAIMTGAFLDDARLEGTVLNDADLTGASLTGVIADGGKFQRTNFTDADLTGAAFSSTNLTDANFTDADLTGVNFRDATLDGVDFTGATWTDGDCICSNSGCSNCM